MREHVNFGALRIWVFGILLIEISSRKAAPEVTSTFPGPYITDIVHSAGGDEAARYPSQTSTIPYIRALRPMLLSLVLRLSSESTRGFRPTRIPSSTARCGAQRPIAAKLTSFGKVHGLAFGWYGECNPALEQLLSRAAEFGSQHLWQPMMAASRGKARGILMWNLRRKIGAAIVRANGMLLMDRVAQPGVKRPRLIRGSPGRSLGSFWGGGQLRLSMLTVSSGM